MAQIDKPRTQQITERLGQLRQERSSWMKRWRDVSGYVLPANGRFLVTDRNRGDRHKGNNIYDSTATKAVRVLGAGMMSGATSPARQWFKLTTSDQELNKNDEVKFWLEEVTNLLQRQFRRTNTYRSFHSMYEELGAFGTAAAILLPNHKTGVLHHHTQTAGQFYIATDFQGDVDTIYREFSVSVSALVGEFGLGNVSNHVKQLYNKGSYDQWITVVHAVEPRRDRDPKNPLATNMEWASTYMEKESNDKKLLRDSGYHKFPALVPRWFVAGGDIYGTSPAMDTLGDIKQLQHQQLRKAQVIDYQTKPPLQVPSAFKNKDVDMLPGGITYVDAGNNAEIKTAFNVQLNLSHLREDIIDVRQRINAGFFSDLFLMLANATDTRMTATEVAERHEEKLIMLGPVIERLHNEMLDPNITLHFENLAQTGQLPPTPDALKGQNISVEYVSMLAQAQKAIQTNAVDRFVMSLGQVANIKPEVLDNFDVDRWADIYGGMLGIDPTLILPEDEVAQIRDSRAKQAQQDQQTAQMAQESQIAKNLSDADLSTANELTNGIGDLTGYTQQ